MLKLTYTENSFSLEMLNESLEDWVNTRVILALRSHTKIYIEPSTAAFLLPGNLPHLADVAQENIVELCSCDADLVEVILKGTWLTSDTDNEVGIFVTALSKSAELLLNQLSQSEQFCHA
ncbi:alr0857 family protein [Nostoc sp. MG11]|uniref:alr0857 family protein n=1 Tax=Nostoc sp. MG11 TaxID=2721166 RepID=UPI0018679BC4|nr:alr0857 family protein [Nostoc sp. MG11]